MVNSTLTSTGPTVHLRPQWWAYLLNGLLSILFGIVALVWPGRALVTLEGFFAAFAIISGVLTIVAALQARTAIPGQWGYLLLVGVLAIIAGLLGLLLPGAVLLTFVYIVAAWALVSGVLEIYSFLRMSDHAHRWWMIIGGILSVLFAILAVILPGLTLEVFITVIAVYAIIGGIMRIIFAFQMRSTS